MPAATTTTRREAADRERRRIAGRATRERLHAIAWAMYRDGEPHDPTTLAGRLGASRPAMQRHAKALRAAGRWPWDRGGGRWKAADGAGPGESRARALVDHPATARILAGVVAGYARRLPRLADEFESHAWAILWPVALGYRADRATSWPSHLRARLALGMADCCRTWSHARRGVDRPAMTSIDAPATGDDGPTIADELAADELPVGWEVDSEDAVEAILGKLGGRRKWAVMAIFMMAAEGYGGLAGRMGTTEANLLFHRRNGLADLRKAMNGEDGG